MFISSNIPSVSVSRETILPEIINEGMKGLIHAAESRQPQIPRSPLRKENEALQKRLPKAEQVIDVQGKIYALLRAVAGESAYQMDLPPWQKTFVRHAPPEGCRRLPLAHRVNEPT
jgi:hypothetical protein